MKLLEWVLEHGWWAVPCFLFMIFCVVSLCFGGPAYQALFFALTANIYLAAYMIVEKIKDDHRKHRVEG